MRIEQIFQHFLYVAIGHNNNWITLLFKVSLCNERMVIKHFCESGHSFQLKINKLIIK